MCGWVDHSSVSSVLVRVYILYFQTDIKRSLFSTANVKRVACLL